MSPPFKIRNIVSLQEHHLLAILFVNTHKNIIFVHIETTHISHSFMD